MIFADEESLREKVANYLAATPGLQEAIDKVVGPIIKAGGTPYYFGGFLRSCYMGLPVNDIDIVVCNLNCRLENVAGSVFVEIEDDGEGIEGAEYASSVTVDGFDFDVWRIEESWAFNNSSSLSAIPNYLPLTTHLNLEAVTMMVKPQGFGHRQAVYSKGFFEGVRDKTIRVNSEDNSSSINCTLRALLLAARTGFSIYMSVAGYIAYNIQITPDAAYSEWQIEKYGKVLISRDDTIDICADVLKGTNVVIAERMLKQ